MVAPLPGATVAKPALAPSRFLANRRRDRSQDGSRCAFLAEGGYLVVTRPWPGQLRAPSGAIPGAIARPTSETSKVDGRPVYFTGTALASTKTAICGSWVASMMCSTSPDIHRHR